MEPKEVPYDLFPVHVKHLRRNNWAQNTFKYWCAFHVRNPPLESWISAAEDIIEGLKAMGVSKAQDKICQMMKTYFALDPAVQECCSLYEVIEVLSKPSNFKDNMELFRNMLHMFQYGIFRIGYNGWAHQAANEWMQERNICYNGTNDNYLQRKTKEFVHKSIVSQASNSICDRFQSFSIRRYEEYVTVRHKTVKKCGNCYELIPKTFNHRFQGYLAKRAENNSNADDDK